MESQKWVHQRFNGISGRLRNNVNFLWRRHSEGGRVVLIKQFYWEVNPMGRWNMYPYFVISVTHLVVCGGGKSEMFLGLVQGVIWLVFHFESDSSRSGGASYHVKGKMYRACVQSVLKYGTETWAMKDENLHSLERTECMMVKSLKWMCGMSSKSRKHNVNLYSLLGSVADVMRLGHLEHKCEENLVVDIWRWWNRKTGRMCEWWHGIAWSATSMGNFQGCVEGLDMGQMPNPSLAWKKGMFLK